VPISTRFLQTIVEIWDRKDEPETADLRRVLHAAEVLEGDPSSPTHLRAFAWRLVVETHRAAGWDLPSDVSLASCRAAADSVSHACSLLMTDVTSQIHGLGSPVLLLGGLAESRSVFERWDLVPANSAVLVAFYHREGEYLGSADLPITSGVRWASPGKHRELYEEYAVPAALNGDQVLVPRPELVAARIADRNLKPEEPSALVFSGAAHAVGDWSEVTRIAKRLGRASAPTQAAVALGLETYLGLETPKVHRWLNPLRRILRR
jgi:hypothetical protein